MINPENTDTPWPVFN